MSYRHPEPPPPGYELTAAKIEHAYATMRDIIVDLTPRAA